MDNDNHGFWISLGPRRHSMYAARVTAGNEIKLDEPYTAGDDGSGGEIVWFELYEDNEGNPHARVAGTGRDRPEPLSM